MLIKFFPNGKGAGAGPVGYLIADEVLAYDANRDLIRDADGQPQTVTRDPLPEVLRGNPDRTEALIDASNNQWTYRAGVISFAIEDAPTEAQQAEVMDAFEALSFAGMDPEQYDMLWVRHTHEDRVELHFCTPRLELTTGNSLNIAPPGYQDAYDSLRDLMNKTHGWTDPMDLERAQEVQAMAEAPTRAQGRDELHDWILDQISVGTIIDRASMVDALTDAGFDIPRASKNYITAKEPDTGERWRLKGEIFHENWQAAPAEREIERGSGHGPAGTRRLDEFSVGELQDRFQRYCDKRAEYNRDRYQLFSERQQERIAETERANPALADDIALGDRGADHGVGRLDNGRELALDGPFDALGTDRTGPDTDRTGRADLADVGSRSDRAENLHDGGNTDHLHRNQGAINGDTPDSLGARFARLRRAIGDGLRNLGAGIARFGSTLDERDREQSEWVGALRGAADEISSLVGRHIGRLAERGADLRDASRGLRGQLEISETRRTTAERELNEQERGHSHGL